MLGGAVPPSRTAVLFHVPLRVGMGWEERSCSQVSLEKLIGPREPDLTSLEGRRGSAKQPALSQPRFHLVALETLGVVLSPQSRRVCLPVG